MKRIALVLFMLCSLPALAAAATFYVSPTGSGSTCSTGSPCALSRLALTSGSPRPVAGDTWIVKNGTYSISGLHLNCSGGVNSGTSGSRITLQAETERQAFLSGNGSADAVLQMTGCQYWTVEGLRVRGADNSSSVNGYVVRLAGSDNNIFRRLLLTHNNRYYNSHLFGLEGLSNSSDNNLIEESEFYYSHRHGIYNGGGRGNTFRRNYFNKRNYGRIAGGEQSTATGPIAIYPGIDNIIENNISENWQDGFFLQSEYGPSSNNKFLGNIAIGGEYGIQFATYVGFQHADTFVENHVSVGPANWGMGMRGSLNGRVSGYTYIGPTSVSASNTRGFIADNEAATESGPPSTVTSNVILENMLLRNGYKGFNITNQSTWSLDSVGVSGMQTTDTPSGADSHITNKRTDDPNLGACRVMIPTTSGYKTAGEGGRDIGANVIYQYQGGVLTVTPLWNPQFVGCGAIVSGVNDQSGASCADVHTRLNVTAPGAGTGCPLPYGTNPLPQPLGNLAKYTFEEGTGTTAVDSSGNGLHCTLTSAAWGPGIIGNASFAPTGAQSCGATMATGLRPSIGAGLSAWINTTTPTTPNGFLVALPGDAVALYLSEDGTLGGQVVIGGSFHNVTWGQVLSDGQSHHVSLSYASGDGLRLRIDNIQVAFMALSGALDYSFGGGGQLRVGRADLEAGHNMSGRIDQVYVFDEPITPEGNTALFEEVVPATGMSVTHMAWYQANAAQGVQVGTPDTNRAHPILDPLGIRWAIHKADAGALTEYFRPFCRVLSSSGSLLLDWTEVTNSFGSLGVRYLQDSVITQGDATAILLPTDGFTPVAGKVLENPIDTTAPYDASQRITLGQGQHTELEIRVEFGPPLVGGEQIECRPQRENALPFEHYSTLSQLYLVPAVALTQVLLPEASSPAVNAATCLAQVPLDIQGILRPQGLNCDIGAYEIAGAAIAAQRVGGIWAGGTNR